MSKVYGYCRVALKNEEEIAQQRKIIDCYCEGKGLKVDAYFCDNGASGLRYDRSGLHRMFRVLQEGDTIIIKDIAKLSRGVDQCMYFVEKIQKAGATLEIINI